MRIESTREVNRQGAKDAKVGTVTNIGVLGVMAVEASTARFE